MINKTIKSNKKKRKKKRDKEIENYIEQKFKIRKQQQPFHRILELALLNNEKKYKESNNKSSSIHTNKTALHNETGNNNRALQRLQTLSAC